jgi:hypothetical protein
MNAKDIFYFISQSLSTCHHFPAAFREDLPLARIAAIPFLWSQHDLPILAAADHLPNLGQANTPYPEAISGTIKCR